MLLRSRNLLRFHAIGLGRPAGCGSLIPARSERGNRSNGDSCTRGSRWICRSTSTTRSHSQSSKAHCSRRNRFYLPDGRISAGALYENPTRVASLLFLHAATGETECTAVVVFGVHAGTAEDQVRPVHARRRRRRTAPGVTERAHNVQVAGIVGAVTRSGVEVGSARSAKYKLRLLLRSLNRTLASP